MSSCCCSLPAGTGPIHTHTRTLLLPTMRRSSELIDEMPPLQRMQRGIWHLAHTHTHTHAHTHTHTHAHAHTRTHTHTHTRARARTHTCDTGQAPTIEAACRIMMQHPEMGEASDEVCRQAHVEQSDVCPFVRDLRAAADSLSTPRVARSVCMCVAGPTSLLKCLRTFDRGC